MLECATNNKSETVGNLFVRETDSYGVPSRIRTDHGCKNVLIWQIMEGVRELGRGSALNDIYFLKGPRLFPI